MAKEVLILLLVLVCRNGLCALAYNFWRSASWWGYHRLWIPEAFLEGHGSRWVIAFLIYTNAEKKKPRTQ